MGAEETGRNVLMKPSDPPPVNLFVGILYTDAALLERAIERLEEQFGQIEYRSPVYAFDITDYYVPEMGSPIFRLFLSFQKTVNPKDLARIKIETNRIEETLAVDGKRKVNLDCGILDYDKVVLASAKYNGQKVYLDFGVWADLTLHYNKGRFDPYPWSFPDFKSGTYSDAFLRMRQLYKQKRTGGS